MSPQLLSTNRSLHCEVIDIFTTNGVHKVTTLFALLLNNLERVSGAIVPNFDQLIRPSVVNSPLPPTRQLANKSARLTQARTPPNPHYRPHPLAIPSTPQPPHPSLHPSQGALKAHLPKQTLGNPRRSGTTTNKAALPSRRRKER